MRKVAVVGVGQLPFRSRYPDKLYIELAYEATKRALEDARISIQDIDSAVYSVYCEIMMRQQIADCQIHDYIGLSGKTGLRVAAGASTGGHAMRVAFAEVASGMSDVVLLLGVQKGSDVIDPVTMDRGEGLMMSQGLSADQIWLSQLTCLPPAMWAHIVVQHMEKYGNPTLEQMARVSVKNHKNALVNPFAQVKVDLTVEDVLNSRLIAWPSTMYMCCLYGECAAAVILASEEKAREITDKPIWVTGVGACNEQSVPEQPPERMGTMPAVSGAARMAYKMAGISNPIDELDLVELHDLITGIECLNYEDLGLCGPGECGRLIDEGITEKAGKLPVNPSGGRTACGHIAGVSGIYSIGEVALQLREEAGTRQVAIRKGRGLIETMGSGIASHAAVIVLER